MRVVHCSSILAIFLLASLQVLRGQELLDCFSCADIFDKCEIDCSWNLQGYSVDDVTSCHSDCATALGIFELLSPFFLSLTLYFLSDSCVDSDEVTTCNSCALTCSETYDIEMRLCLATITRSAIGSYTDYWSTCELSASTTMDSCVAACK